MSVLKTTLVATVAAAALMAVGVGSAQAERGPDGKLYGAIAVSANGSGGSGYGSAWNYPSAELAERDAMAKCNHASCRIYASWSDGCAAIAESSGKVIHDAGIGATREEAEAAAYDKLHKWTMQPASGSSQPPQDYGHIQTWVCTG